MSQPVSKKWMARASSNIALIKYMGKLDTATGESGNKPTNSSLSYTLPHLSSFVVLEPSSLKAVDSWAPLTSHEGLRFEALELSEKGRTRFLDHLANVKSMFGVRDSFLVRSVNDFPSDCGLASSASSFAALTMAAVEACADISGKARPSVYEAAEISRRGSGSSCRSFFAPWSQWGAEGAREVSDLPQTDLVHQVVVVNDSVKAVSSSLAHRRVATSDLFRGRPERAEERVHDFTRALRDNQWAQAFEIAWAEFWDMHALFETSRPSFGYMTAGSLDVLRTVRSATWDEKGDGPLVTMDAGPNVHLLYRNDDAGMAQARELEQVFQSRYQVFSSPHLKSSSLRGGSR